MRPDEKISFSLLNKNIKNQFPSICVRLSGVILRLGSILRKELYFNYQIRQIWEETENDKKKRKLNYLDWLKPLEQTQNLRVDAMSRFLNGTTSVSFCL